MVTAMLIAISFASSGLPAFAGVSTKFALLIGNDEYPPAVGSLVNPPNDVELLRKALLMDGFLDADIQIIKNATMIAMRKSFDAFVEKVQKGGPNALSFVYYSGHGAANEQHENYLIPVDVPELLTTDFWYYAFPLRDLIELLSTKAPNAKHFVVFDACRNSLVLKDPGHKSIVQPKGFVPVAIPGGMLIAFATADGKVASDVGVGAGPYAQALAAEIVKPGVEAFTAFRSAQLRVLKNTGQEPWMNSGPMAEAYFAGADAGSSAGVSAVTTPAPQYSGGVSVLPDECIRNQKLRAVVLSVPGRDPKPLVNGLAAACFKTQIGAYPQGIRVDPHNSGTSYIIPSSRLEATFSKTLEDSVVRIAQSTLPPDLAAMHPVDDTSSPGIFRGGPGPIFGDITIYLF